MTHPIDPPRTRRCRLPRRRTLLAALLFAGLPFAGTLAAALPAREGAPAPEFHVRSLDGQDLRLASLRHHGPVIVEFWGLKCDSCSAGLTELEGWRKRYGPNGLSIVAFSMDGTGNVALVRPYVARLHVGYPVVIDDGLHVQRLYQASHVPSSFLVDRAGNIAAIRDGFVRGDTAFVARIEAQLPKAGGGGR